MVMFVPEHDTTFIAMLAHPRRVTPFFERVRDSKTDQGDDESMVDCERIIDISSSVDCEPYRYTDNKIERADPDSTFRHGARSTRDGEDSKTASYCLQCFRVRQGDSEKSLGLGDKTGRRSHESENCRCIGTRYCHFVKEER